ncbi:MAG: DUF3857 domain-containing protein [Flavobacteriaceae bacterium]|nr:DUF3857 domain-containing protein [Flavobacteriaceae bacterium]
MATRFLGVLLLFTIQIFAQSEEFYQVKTIPVELRKQANAVIRYDNLSIDIASRNSLNTKFKRIVAVFNETGLNSIGTSISYDQSKKIKELGAIIYDASGNELEKYRESDFEDVSAVSDFSLYEDSRVKYLDYVPREYPITVEFFYETSTKNTVIADSWYPQPNYYISTEFSEYSLTYPEGMELNIKADNFGDLDITKVNADNQIKYVAKYISAIQPEDYSPRLADIAPVVKVAPKEFYYEGYEGENSNWEEMGRWMYNELLKDGLELPLETKNEIRSLVQGITDPVEKSKIVYDYMQKRTRYISVQEGIGGIKPFPAARVDEVKYGDCKALTNYTMALLKAVGVESYYSRVYASPSYTVDVDEDFVSFVGHTNHVILNVPSEQGDLWLECTSQTNPFGFISGFTDDRNVFVVTPEGGKIVKTQAYPTRDNLQETKSDIMIGLDGQITAEVEIKTFGFQYSLHRDLQFMTSKNQELSLKNYWDYINGLNLVEFDFNDDKDNVVFTETAKINTSDYVTKTGNLFLLRPNVFNRFERIPTRYDNRMHEVSLDRGFTDKDEFTITLADGLAVEALPSDTELVSKYGEYRFAVKEVAPNKLVYTRTFILNKGIYPKEEYEDFRAFLASVVKNDNSKLALKLN